MSESYDDDPHKLTEKEKCFRDALAAYKRAFPDKDPKVELFKDWYRDVDGKWYQADFVWSFGHWIGSILKTGRIMAGEEDARDSPDAPNPEQVRTPDITAPDGKVYDLKFTNSQGGVDPWGNKKGMGGGTQKDDQAAINKQAGVDKAMSLDKNSCKCAERQDEHGEPKPVELPVDVNSPFIFSQPAPGTASAPSTGQAPVAPDEAPAIPPGQAPAPVPEQVPVGPRIMPEPIPWP